MHFYGLSLIGPILRVVDQKDRSIGVVREAWLTPAQGRRLNVILLVEKRHDVPAKLVVPRGPALEHYSMMVQSSDSMSVWEASQPIRIEPSAVFMVMHGSTLA